MEGAHSAFLFLSHHHIDLKKKWIRLETLLFLYRNIIPNTKKDKFGRLNTWKKVNTLKINIVRQKKAISVGVFSVKNKEKKDFRYLGYERLDNVSIWTSHVLGAIGDTRWSFWTMDGIKLRIFLFLSREIEILRIEDSISLTESCCSRAARPYISSRTSMRL